MSLDKMRWFAEQARRLLNLDRAIFCRRSKTGAISSVVERLLHTQEVAGSNPASRTIFLFAPEGNTLQK
jgi:hypothetical protein